MNIYVNNEKLNFKLENEANLYDIATQIQKWANGNNQYLRQIDSDGNVFYQIDDNMKSYSIDTLKEVRFDVISPGELAIDAIENGKKFFQNIGELLNRQEETDYDLTELLEWTYNILAKSRVVLDLDYTLPAGDGTINSELEKLEDLIAELKKPDANKELIRALDLEMWDSILKKLLEQARSKSAVSVPPPEKKDLINKLQADKMGIPVLITLIEKITTDLHTGGDNLAMEQLNNLSEKLTSIVKNFQAADRFLPGSFTDISTAEGKTISEELGSLTDILRQIIETFQSRDIVLLCDLLEYELSPKLTNLQSIIDLLLKKITETIN